MWTAIGLATVFTIWATAATAAMPTSFAKGGETAQARVAKVDGRWPDKLVLRAFGRTWTDPIPVTDQRIHVTLPPVRVNTVFAIVEASEPHREAGRLVAYAEVPSRWKRGPVRIYAAKVPVWFRQWAEVTGADIRPIELEDLIGRERTFAKDETELLVLGATAAGKDWAGVARITERYEINVLLLDAQWFGEKSQDRFPLSPRQLGGPLAELSLQRWGRTPAFSERASPWPGIMNRLAWIQTEESPLLEQVGPPSHLHKVVLNYLPWDQQLGQIEVVDTALVAVIRAAARPGEPSTRVGRIELLYPSVQRRETDEARRPVLARALQAEGEASDHVTLLSVVDLRGQEPSPGALAETLRSGKSRFDKEHPLLVLGEDSVLDRVEWLGRDRKARKRNKVPGFTWLPDDVLPPSTDSQVRLMHVLTEYGISLGTSEKENGS